MNLQANHPIKMIFKCFLPSTDIIRVPRLPPSDLAPSSPTKVQHLWLCASIPKASYIAPPKNLTISLLLCENHVALIMALSCFNFRTACSYSSRENSMTLRLAYEAISKPCWLNSKTHGGQLQKQGCSESWDTNKNKNILAHLSWHPFQL